ncbi:MAG: hypothetical protein D6719_00440 [Candidatus Dadabacteria bacterium]|nr:MAG: hypothetical protein D6719_00440 [Candidatus Dadabacteria bacterium]
MKTVLGLLLFLTFLFAPLRLAAEPYSIEVNIPVDREPQVAIGLLMNEKTTIQKPNAKIVHTRSGMTTAVFTVDSSEITPLSSASAMVIYDDGSFAFGDIRKLSPGKPVFMRANLPDCPAPEVKVDATLYGQRALLEQLVKIRRERIAFAKRKIAELLANGYDRKLLKAEVSFGLLRKPVISPEDNSVELVDRLSRLLAATKTYKERRAISTK